jgi:uncharacterized protein (TIGR00255 family)
MDQSVERCAVKSMTGFARVSGSCADVDFEAEIRSVNHRFLEVAIRGPRSIVEFERELRATIQRDHRRGRFELSISRRVRATSSGASLVQSTVSGQAEKFDAAVSTYAAACKRYGFGVEGLPHFISELVLRDAASSTDTNELSEQEVTTIRELVTRCSRMLRQDREAEGAALVADIEPRVAAIGSMREAISMRVAGSAGRLRERITERLAALDPEVRVDPERLALEVALLADRVDVSEELSRLHIHLGQFTNLMQQGSPEGIGRKLDFTVQEIGRELNTIGSKAQDAQVQGIVVEAKAELERIREQVQNIE